MKGFTWLPGNRRKKRSRLKSLFQVIPDTIIRLNDQGVLLEWVSSGESNLCIVPQSFVGRSIEEIHPEFAGEAMVCLKRALRTKQPQGFEWEFSTEKGKSFYEIRFIASGKREVIGIARDISRQKSTEEQLRASELRFKETANLLPSMICEIDTKYNLTFANRATFQTLGYNQCCKGTGFFLPEIIHPEDRERLHHNLNRLFCGEEVGPEEYRLIKEDGSEITVFTNSCPIIKGSKVSGVRFSMIDITHRKASEEALANEKERLAVVVESMGEGMIATDKEGKVMLINGVAADVLGWSRKEFLGRDIGEIFKIFHSKTGNKLANPVQQVLEKKEKYIKHHATLYNKQGEKRIITVSCSPMKSQGGQVIGAVMVFHDITEVNLLEAEVAKVQKMETVGLLAGGIAHDFNNMLAEILATLQLAKIQQKRGVEISGYFQEMEKAIERASGLTKQLLTFSKGGIPVKKKMTVCELIKETVKFAIRGTNVVCRFNFPEERWIVEIDEGQICQVINNLTINAVQAMPRGGRLKVAVEKVEIGPEDPLPVKAGRYVKIVFSDQGVGIAPEDLGKVFDPFYTTKAKGNGLGLATSYSIIKKHEGYIRVESEQAVGTNFYLYLPTVSKNTGNKEKSKAPTLLGKGKILVMDDEEAIRRNIKELLECTGYQVAVAKDGVEAVRLYKEACSSEEPFDVVVMDLTVAGGMGGQEALRIIKGIDPRVKAIVSSGYNSNPVLSNYKACGFCGVLTKPYTIERLDRALKKIINHKS